MKLIKYLKKNIINEHNINKIKFNKLIFIKYQNIIKTTKI